MSKTPSYQRKASQDYRKRLKEAGYKNVSIWIREEWREKILAYIRKLKEQK